MRRIALLAPHLSARTGGSIYNRRMAAGLRDLGWSVEEVPLDESFPNPTAQALVDAGTRLATLPPDTIALIDSLAFGAMPDIVTAVADRLRIVALIHLPLAADVSLDATAAARFEDSERRALHSVSLVIVTGAAAVPLLARYALPHDRIRVIEPGVDPARPSRGSNGSRVELLCVATLNPIKGHDVLLEALARVPDERWHLTCAGSLTHHPPTVDNVRSAIARHGLDSRVTLAGDLDEPALEDLYDRSDVAVLASRQETYGMVAAGALAHGLPLVTTATGAAPKLVGSDAGLVVPPGDVDALSAALARVIGDESLRLRLRDGARRAGMRLPSWADAARQLASVLDEIPENG